MFLMAERRRFPGCPAGNKPVNALLDLPFNKLTIRFFVNMSVFERQNLSGNCTFQHKNSLFLQDIPDMGIKHGINLFRCSKNTRAGGIFMPSAIKPRQNSADIVIAC